MNFLLFKVIHDKDGFQRFQSNFSIQIDFIFKTVLLYEIWFHFLRLIKVSCEKFFFIYLKYIIIIFLAAHIVLLNF